MKLGKCFTSVILVSLVSFSATAQQSVPPANEAAAGRANAEQNRLIEQQRESRQREDAVSAPIVRSAAPAKPGWPELPTEQPCFTIQTFTLEVPSTLPAAMREAGASALPQDRFAFAQAWLHRRQFLKGLVAVNERH